MYVCAHMEYVGEVLGVVSLSFRQGTCMYCSLAKKGPWAVHLTLGSNWGVGQHSNYQYCVYY